MISFELGITLLGLLRTVDGGHLRLPLSALKQLGFGRDGSR